MCIYIYALLYGEREIYTRTQLSLTESDTIFSSHASKITCASKRKYIDDVCTTSNRSITTMLRYMYGYSRLHLHVIVHLIPVGMLAVLQDLLHRRARAHTHTHTHAHAHAHARTRTHKRSECSLCFRIA